MKRQSGITLIGFVFLLIVVGFFAYTAMKLVPAYMDYLNVSKALETVASQANSSSGMTIAQLHDALDTQQLSQYFDDSDIADGNIHVVTNSGHGTVLQVIYDKKIPWIYNIDFLVHFEKSVPIQTSSQS
jgi:Tfp pilus assembly major pilin PilA